MKLLYLDVETAPHKVYVWGLFKQDIALSQIVESGYTMCWAAKWEGVAGINFRSIYHDSEARMVRDMWDLIHAADAVVHYNGTRFDMPTLNNEFAKHGWGEPSPVHHIDLLKTARKKFRLASNKLDYVSGFFGVGSKLEHKGMSLWRECMDGDPKAWEQMKRYNMQDVALLPKLYRKMRGWIDGHPNVGLINGMTKPACTNCGGPVNWQGYKYTKTVRYRQWQCKRCKRWGRERTQSTPPDVKRALLTS